MLIPTNPLTGLVYSKKEKKFVVKKTKNPTKTDIADAEYEADLKTTLEQLHVLFKNEILAIDSMVKNGPDILSIMKLTKALTALWGIK